MPSSDFYINLPSNTHNDQQFNTTSSFRIRLPHEIRLTGEWEVALVEIQYPRSWNNTTADKGSLGVRNNEIVYRAKEFDRISNPKVATITPSYYGNVHNLLQSIKKAKVKQLNDENVYEELYENTEDSFQFDYDSVINRVTFNSDSHSVFLSDKLSYMLGFEDRFIKDTAIAKHAPDMRGGIDSLYVYCDICEPQIVGNSLERLLRIIPVKGSYGDIVMETFTLPHYINVLHKSFSTIQVSIKSDVDLPIPFSFGKCVVKLHFRKK